MNLFNQEPEDCHEVACTDCGVAFWTLVSDPRPFRCTDCTHKADAERIPQTAIVLASKE